MSSASFAALRKTQGEEFAKLAEEHFKHEQVLSDFYFSSANLASVFKKTTKKL
jgi:hypothetical protein